jgi:hypothetical protein
MKHYAMKMDGEVDVLSTDSMTLRNASDDLSAQKQ